MNMQTVGVQLKIAAVAIFLGVTPMAQAVEEAQYLKIREIGAAEVRYYPPSIQAVTTLSSNKQTSKGFRRLAGYIFGGNDGTQEIAMTAPVQETLTEGPAEMAFTMPASYQWEDLPNPADPNVSLVRVPGRLMAVVRFSGWATAARVEEHQQLLQMALANGQVNAVGTPKLNQYNPPWTLPFLRRNEIMLEIDGSVEDHQWAASQSTLAQPGQPTYSF
jgi:hypothetical protein